MFGILALTVDQLFRLLPQFRLRRSFCRRGGQPAARLLLCRDARITAFSHMTSHHRGYIPHILECGFLATCQQLSFWDSFARASLVY